MLILALESSAKPVSAAVYDDSGTGKLLGQHFQNNGFSHSRTLLAMAGSLLQNLGLQTADIGLFAVAIGPGSFTGVRIGVSAAKGLAFGTDTHVCGVSTLEAMAYQIMNTADDGAIICPVMDARRGQVYNALFRHDAGTLMRLSGDRAISINDLLSELRDYAVPYIPVGDGTDILNPGPDAVPLCPLSKYQTAYGVAIAALHAKPVTAAELEPAYLRPPQAERVRKEQQEKRGDPVQ